MIRRFNSYFAATSVVWLTLAISSYGQTYMIDINDADDPITETGWTGLDAVHSGSGSSVLIDGISFEIFSADGARVRGGSASPTPNALTGDFVFDDGSNQAVGMFFGGAGDLPRGVWQVDVYIFDDGSTIENQIVGWRKDGAETIIGTDFLPDATNPAATFEFLSNGAAAYDVFVRENNDANRSRLNAVALTYVRIPEPSSVVLLGALAALGAMAFRHR
ncbi:PEP-CTERM sorting domain-containing protein [Aeoliella sp.]|uniref:PEP-CTERM sorting domain-containing protein n=1 Tax=Aeoliella sp. TaxID=2795800 RepID=UPI003CCBB919